MYDDGSRAEEQEYKMLKMWSKSAFIAGAIKFSISDPTTAKKHAETEFEIWWREKDQLHGRV